MAAPVADLEISLKRCDPPGVDAPITGERHTYAIEMRFSSPDSDSDTRVGVDQPVQALFDYDQLKALAGDPGAYAAAFTDSLFADAAFRAEFLRALTAAQSAGLALRVRLLADYAAPELLNLRWESLLDPERRAPLFTGEQVYFSRFLISRDWRPVQLLPRGDLRALVAIANPGGLDAIHLGAVDVAGELGRARAGLCDMPLDPLATGEPDASGAAQRCTLQRLTDSLRAGGPDGRGYDVLYLVCHGAYIREEPWLVLEDENGQAARVPGSELVNRIFELEKRPRLVVLASCQSAGVSAGQALTALGPRLAEAGVPAVLAMQGSVSMSTVEAFMPAFFSELAKDGQIDRAAAVARGRVREAPDFWMPVLFMRLKSGRLWYTPGFGDSGPGFKKWESLIANLKRGQCTPIIGPGITDALMGSTREIAARWAEQYHYPMEAHERDDLPQVAQYLSIQQDLSFPRYQLIDFLRARLAERCAGLLPDALKAPDADLDAMLECVMHARAAELAARGKVEPHQLLASLPLPIYITTGFSNLLASALKAAGKDPKVVICPWNEIIAQANTINDLDRDYRPTAASPLVYHLFGRFDNPDSLVLTEDDYFDYLIGVTKNEDLIPSFVRTALAATSLLFLGFQLDEWDFRVLFRSINGQEGGALRRRYISVGVQVDQEGGEIADPNRARSYLESYFDTAFISLYWGGAEDFIQDLAAQLKAKPT